MAERITPFIGEDARSFAPPLSHKGIRHLHARRVAYIAMKHMNMS